MHITQDQLASGEDTAVYWLGCAGFLIRARDTILLLDACIIIQDGVSETGLTPFFPVPIQPHELPALDAVLYTHCDGDHMGLRTAHALKDKAARFIGPAPCAAALSREGFDGSRLALCRPGETFQVGCINITVLAAQHAWQQMDTARYGAPFGPQDCVGYSIQTPHAKLLFTGDTQLCAHHLQLPDAYDLLALDISNDAYHLGVEGAVALAQHLKRARLLACHWGTYDAPQQAPHNGSLSRMKRALGEDAARLIPAALGQPVVFI